MPYLIAEDANRLIQFLVEAFDAEEIMRFDRPDGSVAHAELRIGGEMLELGGAGGEWKPLQAGIHLYVPDVDAVYEQAIQAGGKPLHPVTDMFYGERSGGVADPAGNQWFIATHTEDVDLEELRRRAAEQGG